MDSNYTPEQIAFLEKRKARLASLIGDGALPSAVSLINEGKGSFEGCLSSLQSLHEEKADYAWFANKDLQDFKLQSYIAGKLQYIRCKHMNEEGFLHEATWFYPLFSDYESLIHYWLSFFPESDFFKRRVANPSQNEYRYYQMTLALRGDWEQLAQRAEVFLSDPPTKMKKYMSDQRFYLALAKGDKAGMEIALTEMTAPKVALKHNGDFYFAFAGRFIACFASLYAKIARRHGYQLDLDTPFIPAEWLPIAPLQDYSDPYDFMRKYIVAP